MEQNIKVERYKLHLNSEASLNSDNNKHSRSCFQMISHFSIGRTKMATNLSFSDSNSFAFEPAAPFALPPPFNSSLEQPPNLKPNLPLLFPCNHPVSPGHRSYFNSKQKRGKMLFHHSSRGEMLRELDKAFFFSSMAERNGTK